jgi:hypothetical protein
MGNGDVTFIGTKSLLMRFVIATHEFGREDHRDFVVCEVRGPTVWTLLEHDNVEPGHR